MEAVVYFEGEKKISRESEGEKVAFGIFKKSYINKW